MAETTAAAPVRVSKQRWRSVVAVLLLIVATVLAPVAITARWANRTVTDTERYLATVVPLAENPVIQTAVADATTQAIMQQLDLANRADQYVPDQLKPLIPALVGGVQSFVNKGVTTFIQSSAFQTLWTNMNQKIQQALIKILEGKDSAFLTNSNGKVTLNLEPVFIAARDYLVSKGLTIAQNIQYPSKAPQEVVLLESKELAQAQTIYQLSQPVAQWLIFAVFAMYIVAAIIAKNRRRVLMWAGVSFFFASLALWLGLKAATSGVSVATAGDKSIFAPAINAFFNQFTTYLWKAADNGMVTGATIAILAFLLGPQRFVVAARTPLVETLMKWGTAVPFLAGFGRWVSGNRTLYTVLDCVIFYVIVYFGKADWRWTIFAGVVFLLVQGVGAVARGSAGATPLPPAAPSDAVPAAA